MTERLRPFNTALTPAQLSKIFNVSKQTILRNSGPGGIPCFKVGNRTRFVPEHVIEWLDTRGKSATNVAA